METADVEGDVIQCLACRLRLALHTRIQAPGGNDEVHPEIEDGFEGLASTNLWVFLMLGFMSVVSCTSSLRSIVVS